MAQHELLMVLAAPLLVAARPVVPALWSLPQIGRRGVGAVIRSDGLSTVWSVLSHPLAAFVLHGAAIWIWHIPALYGRTITSELLHTVQHASFILTALLFWWTVIPGSRAGRNGSAIFSLFATALHTSVLGALLAFSEASWYPTYQATTGPWGMSPLADQQLGGLIMWIPGGLTYLVVALLGIARLLRDVDAPRAASAVQLRVGSVAMVVVLFASACRQGDSKNPQLIAGSDHERGQQIMGAYGCPTCHVIPGVRGATGKVGPPLTGVADRVYLAGRVANEPQNMIDWIRNPQKIDPQTAMPNTGVTELDAHDIAAYLYTHKYVATVERQPSETRKVHEERARELDTESPLKANERQKGSDEQWLDGNVTHEVDRLEGEKELGRTSSALWWAALTGGLAMGLYRVAEGLLRAHLPDAHWRPLITAL